MPEKGNFGCRGTNFLKNNANGDIWSLKLTANFEGAVRLFPNFEGGLGFENLRVGWHPFHPPGRAHVWREPIWHALQATYALIVVFDISRAASE